MTSKRETFSKPSSWKRSRDNFPLQKVVFRVSGTAFCNVFFSFCAFSVARFFNFRLYALCNSGEERVHRIRFASVRFMERSHICFFSVPFVTLISRGRFPKCRLCCVSFLFPSGQSFHKRCIASYFPFHTKIRQNEKKSRKFVRSLLKRGKESCIIEAYSYNYTRVRCFQSYASATFTLR